MNFIGIDPGKSGGIVVLVVNNNNQITKIVSTKMPSSPKAISKFLSLFSKDSHCVLERVNGRPGMGGVAMFSFGKNYGHIEMALTDNNISFDETTPQKWMKEYQMVKKKEESQTQWKNRLKHKAEQLFPSQNITLAVADAFLIAQFCRRNFNK